MSYEIHQEPNETSESGFTMIELLVAATMMVIITAASVTMLVSAMKTQPKVSSNAQQIGQARNAMTKFVNELRQGSAVTLTTASGLTLQTFCGGAGGSSPCTVRYACAQEAGKTTYRCTRAVGTGTARPVVTGLASGSVFSYVPSSGTPEYVGVKVELPASEGDGKTVLENGAALHNSTAYLEG